MKLKPLLLAFLFFAYAEISFAQSFVWKTATSGGYTYKYVTDDPTKSRFYTLKNGLSAFIVSFLLVS